MNMLQSVIKASFIIFLSVIGFTSCGIGVSMNTAISDRDHRVRDFLKRSQIDIPGIQYLVVDSRKVLFEYAGGWRDIRNKKPMTLNTTMMAYSMTKTFTAAAIMKLLYQKKIKLNDSVSSYLKLNPYGDKVTIRHLLTQTSGIPNPIPLRWIHLPSKHKDYNEKAALIKVLKENPRLSFSPGEDYSYSNISYWLLGRIIEKVTGMSYARYMREEVFMPLGLSKHQIDCVIPDPTHHAKGYLEAGSFFDLFKGFVIDSKYLGSYEGRWLNIHNHYLNGPSMGGLIGSAKSFSRFLQDQLNERSVLFGDKVRHLFYTRQVTTSGTPVNMTPGWHIGKVNNEIYYFKEGGGGGYHSEMRIYPSRKLASIIMVNKTNFKSKSYLHVLDKEFQSPGLSKNN